MNLNGKPIPLLWMRVTWIDPAETEHPSIVKKLTKLYGAGPFNIDSVKSGDKGWIVTLSRGGRKMVLRDKQGRLMYLNWNWLRPAVCVV